MSKKQTYQFGILAEKISIFLLIIKGYKILKWRYKSRFGEVDIIAKKAKIIVAIEVKARKSSSKIIIEEILSLKQIERVKKSAQFFVSENLQFHNYDLRFDFIEVNQFYWPKHYLNFIS
jgi:putative endonuclease